MPRTRELDIPRVSVKDGALSYRSVYDSPSQVIDGTDELDDNDLSGLDYKHLPASTIPLDSQKDKHLRIRTSGQVVLEEQDRKKRLKLLS